MQLDSKNHLNTIKLEILSRNIYYITKLFIIFIFCCFFLLNCLYAKKDKSINKSTSYEQFQQKNNNENNIKNIINQNFFVIDSNNLDNIIPHMYGFSISKNGILTDNYYKILGEYEEPLPQGVYIMIRKIKEKIIINQDFYGCFGLYIFENKEDNYFALSNSFLLLEEYLMNKQNISLNKEFADNLIVTSLCSFSIGETLIKEIKQIPSNSFIVIDIKRKKYKINFIDYKENTVPLESEEGLKLIDNWVDKWGYILRSLKKQTDNISIDLSGGFDTRIMFALLLNSGFDLNEFYIHSYQDTKHDHDIDFKIANNISSKFGFKLNKCKLNNNFTILSSKEALFKTLYTKLGFHKEFYIQNQFFHKPRFAFTGSGGEFLRGAPNTPIENFIKSIANNNVKGHEEEFYNSSEKVLNRSISLLKSQKNFSNDFEMSLGLYSKSLGKYHFGKAALESFLSNVYNIQPLMDPEIRKIKYNVDNNTFHDLMAFIFVRFGKDLLDFPFQGNRIIDIKSIKKAEKLNNNLKAYKIKFNYNKKFYIDQTRTLPILISKNDGNSNEYLEKIFMSTKYNTILNKIYDNNVYKWANDYKKNTNYFSLSQHYALLAISTTLDILSINEKFLKNIDQKNSLNKSQILNFN